MTNTLKNGWRGLPENVLAALVDRSRWDHVVQPYGHVTEKG